MLDFQYILGRMRLKRELLEVGETDAEILIRSLQADCGTGAGGFKPGNTCAKGGEDSIAANDPRLVNKKEFSATSEPNSNYAIIPSDGSVIDYLKNSNNPKVQSQKEKFGLSRTLPDGERVALRIDIPVFNDSERDRIAGKIDNAVYAISVHNPGTAKKAFGTVIGYDSMVRLQGDVRFHSNEDRATEIAMGLNTKSPIAVVTGNFDQSREIPSDINDWAPIGYNPVKAAYFFDKRNGREVAGGEDALSVGNSVFLRVPDYKTEKNRTVQMNYRTDCGTGAGGFKPGNTCAKGGVGSNTVYDNESLKAIGEPANYEGGDLVDGMTLWDRYSLPGAGNIDGKGKQDIRLSTELEQKGRMRLDEEDAINAAMPLRTQYDAMRIDGLNAMGVPHTNGSIGDGVGEPHTAGWVASEFSRTSQNELMTLMSEDNPNKEDLAHAISMQSAITSDTAKWITESDVSKLGDLAKNTPLPAGVTLFHGFKDHSQDGLFVRLSREQAVYSLNKLTSTSTRPSVATHFANDNKVYQETREVSVVRILNPKHGLAIGGVSAYQREAEVVLAKGTKFRFTGETHRVNITAANAGGWPSAGVMPPEGFYDKFLIPVKLYDVEVVE